MDKTKALAWLHAAGVRAIKTVAQTAVATIGTAAELPDKDGDGIPDGVDDE